jgi:pimeloyl-ACP methyl ester carboxylesterase
MEKFATLSTGVRLEYVEQGDPGGMPVIFLHGVTDSWHSFELVLPLLPPSLHAFAISQRGHGDSSRPESGYLVVDMARDLGAFMDAMGLRRAVIAGHSMGSMVAQRFVLDHPDRVSGLVLMGAFAGMFEDPGLTEFYRSAIAPLTDPIDAAFALEWQQSTLARPTPPEFLDTVVAETQKVPARVWREAFAGFLDMPDWTGELTRVTVPTLIQWGDQDTYTPRSSQDRLASVIRGARLIVYEGNGHAIHWEDPVRVTNDLVSFLAKQTNGWRERRPSAAAASTRG